MGSSYLPQRSSDAFRRTVKWRTGCEDRISTLKRGYRWDRTRTDGTEGARIWTGHGVLTHNLVKIAALTAPVSTISTPGESAANRPPASRRRGLGCSRATGLAKLTRSVGNPWRVNDDRRIGHYAAGVLRPVRRSSVGRRRRRQRTCGWCSRFSTRGPAGRCDRLDRGDVDRGDVAADPDRGWGGAHDASDQRDTGRPGRAHRR